MGNHKILSAIIVSTLVVVLVVVAAFRITGDSSVLAQGDPSASESSAPLSDTDGEGQVTRPEEEPIDPEAFGPNAPEALTDFRLSGTVLKPRADDVSYIPTAGGGCFYASSGNSFRIFNAPVTLPQGSEILAVRMYYDDTSASNSRGWFSVYDLYGDLVDEWSVDSVGNSGNGFNDTDTINHTIDYASYSYVVNWRPYDLGSDMQLCGFRIFYEPPPFGLQFLPNVIKP